MPFYNTHNNILGSVGSNAADPLANFRNLGSAGSVGDNIGLFNGGLSDGAGGIGGGGIAEFLRNALGQGNGIGGTSITGRDVLGGASAALNGYLGLKQFGLAQDQFNFQRDAFNRNFDNQVATTNRELEDRQRARVGANPNAESVESYLARNRVG